jgi:hypothetical protein
MPMTPEERYRRDVEFKLLVDILYAQIVTARYTPTELREAAILAATMHAEYQPHPDIQYGRTAGEPLGIPRRWPPSSVLSALEDGAEGGTRTRKE